ncbi:TPA: hypothetical protein PTV31_003101 [Clostridium botulinum]|nr:hypothetical protein [Clostridium botulinum]
MAEYLGTVKLGTFYHNGEALSLPTKPWKSGAYPEKLSSRGNGDIAKFSGSINDWIIGDTSSDTDKKLQWVKIKTDNKTLLICTINILNAISWDTLNSAGYTDGTKVTIDGNEYLCRLLSGGNYYRKGTDSYSGGSPIDNEWDRFICNEDNIKGLPIPNAGDLDKAITYDDLDGEHNQLWNWWGNESWCKETTNGNPTGRIVRGGSASNCILTPYNSNNTFSDIGWRPVLEVLESKPETSNSEGNDSDSKDPSTKKFLIKQNENYYTIDNGYINLGQVNTRSDLNNLFNKYGFEDLSLITKEFDGKKVHMTKDKDDIWETDSEIDVNKVEGDVQLVEENNEKYIKYGFGKCNIPDEINRINNGKFKILMK